MTDDFLAKVNQALGTDRPPLDEAGALHEIRRLREAARELERGGGPLDDFEYMRVDEVHRVGTPHREGAAMVVFTEAGVVEASSRTHDGEVRSERFELPRRKIHVFLGKAPTRAMHRILEEAVMSWDEGT